MTRPVLLVLFAIGCSGNPPLRGADGGGFVLPDAGTRDAGFPDSGDHDAGPYVCEPACSGAEVCGCVGTECGCRTPGGVQTLCDPQHPETCAAPLSCLRARVAGTDVHICSDGRLGIACSKTADICTSALGCVCYTPPSGATDCLCIDQQDPQNELCDRMVPETCPNGVCVRAEGSSGRAYFFCSDGAQGKPCEIGDNSCRTSLGCTCPTVFGTQRCICSEPAADGEPCDPSVAGSCIPPLMCQPMQRPDEGITTACSDGTPGGRDGGSGGGGPDCDPTDPLACPPGTICQFTPDGYRCIPG